MVDRKAAEQGGFVCVEFACLAFLVLYQVHGTVQVKHPRGFAFAQGVAQLKGGAWVVKQVIELLGRLHHRPRGEQVVVGAVHGGVAGQFLLPAA